MFRLSQKTRNDYYLPPIVYSKQASKSRNGSHSRQSNGQTLSRANTARLGIARLWLASLMMVVGGLALTDGVAAQKELPTAQDVGSIASSSTSLSGKSLEAKAATPLTTMPNTSNASSTAVAPKQPAAPSKQDHAPKYLPYAEPTHISAPSVGIASDLITVGKTEAGAMEVPAHPNFDKAAWYRYSPTPGQFGASVIIGHVDSYANANGASVFYNLPKLKPGDPIEVKRNDGSIAIFTVKALRNYGKEGLPKEIVYAPVTESAELRLITCSGNFIAATGSYDSNTVVFATLRE